MQFETWRSRRMLGKEASASRPRHRDHAGTTSTFPTTPEPMSKPCTRAGYGTRPPVTGKEYLHDAVNGSMVIEKYTVVAEELRRLFNLPVVGPRGPRRTAFVITKTSAAVADLAAERLHRIIRREDVDAEGRLLPPNAWSAASVRPESCA